MVPHKLIKDFRISVLCIFFLSNMSNFTPVTPFNPTINNKVVKSLYQSKGKLMIYLINNLLVRFTHTVEDVVYVFKKYSFDTISVCILVNLCPPLPVKDILIMLHYLPLVCSKSAMKMVHT